LLKKEVIIIFKQERRPSSGPRKEGRLSKEAFLHVVGLPPDLFSIRAGGHCQFSGKIRRKEKV
jgi:hypothetical protein